jgi:hypothetical protein
VARSIRGARAMAALKRHPPVVSDVDQDNYDMALGAEGSWLVRA